MSAPTCHWYTLSSGCQSCAPNAPDTPTSSFFAISVRQAPGHGLELIRIGLVGEVEALAEVAAVRDRDVRDQCIVAEPRARLEADRMAARVAADQRRRDADAIG